MRLIDFRSKNTFKRNMIFFKISSRNTTFRLVTTKNAVHIPMFTHAIFKLNKAI